MEPQLLARIGSHRHDVGAEKEEGRKGRPLKIQSSSRRLWEPTDEAQSTGIRRGAHPRKVCTSGTVSNL
eukprot:6182306-Pleurochrysis_carterae.AAC.1